MIVYVIENGKKVFQCRVPDRGAVADLKKELGKKYPLGKVVVEGGSSSPSKASPRSKPKPKTIHISTDALRDLYPDRLKKNPTTGSLPSPPSKAAKVVGSGKRTPKSKQEKGDDAE